VSQQVRVSDKKIVWATQKLQNFTPRRWKSV